MPDKQDRGNTRQRFPQYWLSRAQRRTVRLACIAVVLMTLVPPYIGECHYYKDDRPLTTTKFLGYWPLAYPPAPEYVAQEFGFLSTAAQLCDARIDGTRYILQVLAWALLTAGLLATQAMRTPWEATNTRTEEREG